MTHEKIIWIILLLATNGMQVLILAAYRWTCLKKLQEQDELLDKAEGQTSIALDLADGFKDERDKWVAEAKRQQTHADLLENQLQAAQVQTEHYPALQEANKFQVAIVAGMKDRLQTSPTAPFGVYSAKFDKFEDLVLFLMFDAKRPLKVRKAQ